MKILNIKSDINLDNLKLKNSLKLKDIFPKIKKDFTFKNQKIKLEYQKDILHVDGDRDNYFSIDIIKYEFYKRKNLYINFIFNFKKFF